LFLHTRRQTDTWTDATETITALPAISDFSDSSLRFHTSCWVGADQNLLLVISQVA